MLSLFIIMHYCVFILIPSDNDIDGGVAEALAPFDEANDVAPYRVHLDHHRVRMMAEHYGIDPANLHELVKRMPEWTNCKGGVDRAGLYYLSTCNPDGYWDWYEIGGRWHGYIPGSRRNAIAAGKLAASPKLADRLPCYILTPDGEWIEHMRCYVSPDWKDVKIEQMKPEDWLQLVRDTLNRWDDHQVVCVDIHS